MPKTFYTERDIEDLVQDGTQSIIVDDDVVLTDLAYERARNLGLELLREDDKPPAAPERPYIATKRPPPPAASKPASVKGTEAGTDMHTRVREAVIARLGDSVDAKLLDTIITRVLKSIKTS